MQGFLSQQRQPQVQEFLVDALAATHELPHTVLLSSSHRHLIPFAVSSSVHWLFGVHSKMSTYLSVSSNFLLSLMSNLMPLPSNTLHKISGLSHVPGQLLGPSRRSASSREQELCWCSAVPCRAVVSDSSWLLLLLIFFLDSPKHCGTIL